MVGALPSLARSLLVPAYAYLRKRHPGYALDIVEVTPREAREQLVGRILDAAVASDFADGQITDLRATSLARHPHMLAVPRALPDLSTVAHSARELSPEHLAVLRNTVRYAFGSEHSARVNTCTTR